MRETLAGAVVIGLVACAVVAVVAFGAVSVGAAMPVYALACLVALVWAVKLCVGERASWKRSPLHWPVLAFLVYTVVRYLTSELEYESRLELFHVGLYAFAYFAAALNGYRTRDRKIFIGALLGLAVLETAYGFWQFFTESPSVLHLIRPEQYRNRAGGTYICPNHLAGFLEIVIGLALARIAIIRSAKKSSLQKFALKKLFLIYVALVILAGLVATLSRAAWVATLAGFTVFLFLKGWQTRTVWPRVIVGVAGLGVVLAIVVKLEPVRNFIRIGVVENVAVSAEESDVNRIRNAGSRLVMWGATCRMIRDYPVLGTGPGTWKWYHLEYRDPRMQMRPQFVHNDYLHLAADYGWVGVGIVAAALIAFFYHASRFLSKDTSSDKRSFAAGAIVAMVMILVHSLFDFNMHIPANALLICLLMGFTVSMDDSEKRYPRVQMRAWQRFGLVAVVLAVAGIGFWFYGRTYMARRYAVKAQEAKEAMLRAEAVEFCRRGMEWDPNAPDLYAKLGDIYLSQGLLPTESREERDGMLKYSVDLFNESLFLNPRQSDVMVKLANALSVLERNEDALWMFRAALKIDPDNALTFFELGQFYQKMNAKEDALKAFQRSRELNFWTTRATRMIVEQIQSTP